jgi:hypothetical protein
MSTMTEERRKEIEQTNWDAYSGEVCSGAIEELLEENARLTSEVSWRDGSILAFRDTELKFSTAIKLQHKEITRLRVELEEAQTSLAQLQYEQDSLYGIK